MSNTILLDGEGFIREEAVGSGTIKPGMLLEKTSAGLVKAHATEGGRGLVQIAIEDSLQGDTVDDSYADGALVQYAILRPGTRFMGMLLDAQNIAIGDLLVSDGAGRFEKAATASSDGDTDMMQRIMAEALEAEDLTVSGATDTLIRMRAF